MNTSFLGPVFNGKSFPKHLLSWGVAGALSLAILFGAFLETGNVGSAAVRVLAEATNGLLPHDEQGRTNILLLGVGDKSHAASSLTDSIIVASIDADDQNVVLLSVPRDLYIEDAEGVGAGRINALYVTYRAQFNKASGQTESGASLLALRSVADDIGERLGLPIHGVMKMDFDGFTEIIDAVGGVDIDVPERIVDYSYPVEEGVVGIFEIDKGPQHLDGETALKYARSRHSSSDFDRSARQQQILTALGDKVKSTNFISNMDTIRAVQESIRGNFETTFGMTELFALGTTLVSVPRENILRMNLNYATGGDYSEAQAGGFIRIPPEGTFTGAILLPLSPSNDVADWSMIRFFADLIFGHRETYFRAPRIVLVPGGADRIQAHRLRNELLRYGFSVEELQKKFTSDIEQETVITANTSDDVGDASLLSEMLSISLAEQASGSGTGIRITLGEDYRFTPLVRTEAR